MIIFFEYCRNVTCSTLKCIFGSNWIARENLQVVTYLSYLVYFIFTAHLQYGLRYSDIYWVNSTGFQQFVNVFHILVYNLFICLLSLVNVFHILANNLFICLLFPPRLMVPLKNVFGWCSRLHVYSALFEVSKVYTMHSKLVLLYILWFMYSDVSLKFTVWE